MGVTGEVIWRTPPLTTPRPEDMGRPELLMEREAVRLFVDRARLSQPGLELQVPNAAAIAQICNRLEGIPLAIELAAGLAGVMSLEEILGRLRYRFKLLTGGNRGSAPRHQTLRQAVDWSYCLLGPHEQSVFARLGVFAGGFDLPAAEAVVDGDGVDVDDVPSIVSRLANKSLLVAEPTHPHLTRYRMLDTIRDYAVEKLDGHIDTEARQRQARYYLDWCAAATKELSSPDQIAWLNRLDEESPNIRAALEWMLPRQPDDALRLAASLGRYWYMRRRLAEGADWLDHALEATPTPSEGRARGLLAVARLRSRAGEFDRARKDLKECIGLSRRLGLESELARALTLEGVASGYARDWAPALEHFTEALALLRKLGDRIGIIGSL
ncbi:MAG TPA: LuxR family transcriptional regulator, partial [Candidatus Dormibacteraeota bacterium]|nr:LuxR family transcriptional regulator [Candidatus Dormibacteraeota bacterium]